MIRIDFDSAKPTKGLGKIPKALDGRALFLPETDEEFQKRALTGAFQVPESLVRRKRGGGGSR